MAVLGDNSWATPGGGYPPLTTLFDITTPIWAYLGVFDRLAVRQSCRGGLRLHDSLLNTVSVHDLWGRVLPGGHQEVSNTLRRMMKRGCSPQELILRLRGGSAATREVRGLAVLSAFAPSNASTLDHCRGDGCNCNNPGSAVGNKISTFNSSTSIGSSSGCGTDSAGNNCSSRGLTGLRLEGVPLTPRVLHALAAAGRDLQRVKLYGYDICEGSDAAASDLDAHSSMKFCTVVHCGKESIVLERRKGERGPPSPGPAAAQSKSPNARGVPALLRLLAPRLQELTLQDFTLCSIARRNQDNHVSCRKNASSGFRAGNAGGMRDRGAMNIDVFHRVCGCDAPPGALALPTPPLVVALRSCLALRHLGLRHIAADGCPVLPMLLRQPGTCACACCRGVVDGELVRSALSGAPPVSLEQNGKTASSSHHSNPFVRVLCGAQGPTSIDAVSSTSLAAVWPSNPVLATLTQLVSLKLQSALPAPGGVPAFMVALQQLTGLTRLELGERAAVTSMAGLMLQPPPAALLKPALALWKLRDLSLVSVQVTAATELVALAQLQELTRLSLGALSVLGAQEAAGSRSNSGSLLPLPPQLQELSVVASLAPATLLVLKWPLTLRTLRITGFSLGPNDAEESVTGGDSCEAGGRGGNAALLMRRPSERQLSEGLALLHGRFAYRDLGIEMHVCFHAPVAGRRRYLSASGGAEPPLGHWAWASRLEPLSLQGLELAGLDLLEEDVMAMAKQLCSLEDLRLDCRYPLHAVSHLSGLRRLRRLMLYVSFWQSGSAAPLPPPPSEPHLQHPPAEGEVRAGDVGGHQQVGPREQGRTRPDAETAAAGLMALCASAPDCLYDVALASLGKASARFCAMQALVLVEAELNRVGCGSLRLWVCP